MTYSGQDISDQKRAPVTPSLDGGRFDTMSKAARLKILKTRQAELRDLSITYVGNEAEFRAKDSWEKIVDSPEPPSSPREKATFSPEGAEHLQHILRQPLLTREQEVYLFRKMNYLKFVANEVKQTLSIKKVEPKKIARIDELLAQAAEIRDRIVERNTRMVLGIGLKFLPGEIDKCVSIGVIPLMESLKNFDYQRGNKFSTFATRPIRWAFLRHRQSERRPRELFESRALSIEGCDVPDKSEGKSIRQSEERGVKQMTLIKRHLDTLDFREREIIVRRFGLDGAEPETLAQLGDRLGVSKERIRQIQSRVFRTLSGTMSVDEAFPD